MASLGIVWVHSGVALVQVLGAITLIITQVLLNAGLDKLVLGCYLFLPAAFLLGIASFFLEKLNSDKLMIFSRVIPFATTFGILLCIMQMLSFVGITYTSASIALSPTGTVWTVIFGIIAGVETLHLRRYDGQMKAAGILICFFAATLMSLYSGPCVFCPPVNVTPPFLKLGQSSTPTPGLTFTLGVLACIGSSGIVAFLMVFPAKMLKNTSFPALAMTASMYAVGGTVAAVAAFFTLENSAWIVRAQLVTLILFTSFCSLTLIPALIIWGLKRLGPTIVSCYQPLTTVVAALVSVVFLGANIFLGSIIGAALIVLGLLLLGWAQEQSRKLDSQETLPQAYLGLEES